MNKMNAVQIVDILQPAPTLMSRVVSNTTVVGLFVVGSIVGTIDGPNDSDGD